MCEFIHGLEPQSFGDRRCDPPEFARLPGPDRQPFHAIRTGRIMRFKVEVHVEQLADVEKLIEVFDRHRVGAIFLIVLVVAGACLAGSAIWFMKGHW